MMLGYNKGQQDEEADIITLMLRTCVQIIRILLVSLKLKRQIAEIEAIKEIDLNDIDTNNGASEPANKQVSIKAKRR